MPAAIACIIVTAAEIVWQRSHRAAELKLTLNLRPASEGTQ
jgi:hypothetical protein